MFSLFAESPPPPPAGNGWAYVIGMVLFLATQLWQLYKQAKLEEKVETVGKGIDGRMDQLLAVTAQAANLTGQVEGQAQASGVNLGGVRVPDSPQKLSPKSPQGDSGIAKPPDQAP